MGAEEDVLSPAQIDRIDAYMALARRLTDDELAALIEVIIANRITAAERRQR